VESERELQRSSVVPPSATLARSATPALAAKGECKEHHPLHTPAPTPTAFIKTLEVDASPRPWPHPSLLGGRTEGWATTEQCSPHASSCPFPAHPCRRRRSCSAYTHGGIREYGHAILASSSGWRLNGSSSGRAWYHLLPLWLGQPHLPWQPRVSVKSTTPFTHLHQHPPCSSKHLRWTPHRALGPIPHC